MQPLKPIYAKISGPLLCISMVIFFACEAKVDQKSNANRTEVKQEGDSLASTKTDNLDTLRNISDEGIKSSFSEFEKFFQEGNKYSNDGKFLEAISSYHKALELNETAPSIHYNLANVYVTMGKIDDGIKEYKLAIKQNHIAIFSFVVPPQTKLCWTFSP